MAIKLQKGIHSICFQNKRNIFDSSVICKDIELEFGMETNFGLLMSQSNIKLQFDVIIASE